MTSWKTWLDDRTGYRMLLRAALYERIPGGARWRYVWGSTLLFCLLTQFVTGFVLWTAYSPNAQGAWESVNYIQNTMQGGWMLRGIHHYMAHTTTILLVLHLMQVVIDGAYKAPREINFWFGLILLCLVMSLSLTGYLLPWDQTGYWATKVATSIVAVTPVIGSTLQRLLIGGAEYGHQTLTRFFALHAGLLPGTIVLLIVGHVYLFRRHGITVRSTRDSQDGTFWPDQLLRDAVAALAMVVAVVFIVAWTRGVGLDAPADPAEPFPVARPQWYFVFLYQWLKLFPTGTEAVGAILIPTAFFGTIACMPFIARWRLGHRFNVGFLAILLLGMAGLTWRSYSDDRHDAEFLAARDRAMETAERANTLAHAPPGIPAGGAVTLLRHDPLTQGPRLFSQHCSGCHRFDGHDALGNIPPDSASAPDLARFASREWLNGMLDPEQISTERYFGNTRFRRTRMARFVTRSVGQFNGTQRGRLEKVVKAVSAEAELPSQVQIDRRDSMDIIEGRLLLLTDSMRCTECHDYRGSNHDPVGPVLTGYGSKEWLIGIISNPSHSAYYGERNDRMPAFADEGILPREAIDMIADWLRGEWYRPESVSINVED